MLQGGWSALDYYGRNHAKALLDVFPDIGLDEQKFRVKNSMSKGVFAIPYSFEGSYWNNRENRKHFFDLFAENRNFDPLVAGNWYKISKLAITKEQVQNGYDAVN